MRLHRRLGEQRVAPERALGHGHLVRVLVQIDGRSRRHERAQRRRVEDAREEAAGRDQRMLAATCWRRRA